MRHEAFPGIDPVDQIQPQSFPGADQITKGDHFHGLGVYDEPAQSVDSPETGEHPPGKFGQSEPCLFHAETEVAG